MTHATNDTMGVNRDPDQSGPNGHETLVTPWD